MYLRKRKESTDDPYIVSILKQNFKVSSKQSHSIIKKSDGILVLCLENGPIIGFISYRHIFKNVVYVSYVALNQQFQNSGVGKMVLPVFINHAKNEGIQGIMGYVRSDNPEALRSFTKWGFHPIVYANEQTLIGRLI